MKRGKGAWGKTEREKLKSNENMESTAQRQFFDIRETCGIQSAANVLCFYPDEGVCRG